jgi:hypothetical protein
MSDTELTTDAAGTTGGEPDEILEDENDVLEVVAMHASSTVLGSVSAEEFDAEQCLIGSATVDGDASIGASALGVLSANSVGIHQGGAAVMVVDGDVSIDQGAAQVIVARSAGLERGGVGILVTGEADLARSWVGVMAARNATLSDDSRVIIDAKAALIIGALLFGGFGLVALAVLMAGRRIAARIPHMPWAAAGHRGGSLQGHMAKMMRARMGGAAHMPHMPHMPSMPDMSKMPDLSVIADLLAKMRKAA